LELSHSLFPGYQNIMVLLSTLDYGMNVQLLGRSAADEEPLVDGGVDLLGREILVWWQRRELFWSDAAGRMVGGQVGAII
jgi:hypothetical protein